MLLTVVELERSPIAFDLEIAPGQIDFGDELHSIQGLRTSGVADLLQEHRGPHEVVSDIRVRAEFQARVEVLCARCLEPVTHTLGSKFDLLFRPLGVDATGDDRSISPSETEIGYYEKSGLLLEDVLREQVLLSLPARTLCGPSCKGLCPRCGRNLNTETCDCAKDMADPRWSMLESVRRQGKP
ncbi:MAG: YceD family protein [Acidobacteriaceae bacterium]